ncbi:cell wall-binding repeat-containing protein [Candidatus Clostridium stratigraminis]|uniref:Cell wall-binding repeat-containing protein n=1 Tax=Candidatus Clostridium stratigraminis TaxID=3381661 RepID=A0ABW8T457_9CLOT
MNNKKLISFLICMTFIIGNLFVNINVKAEADITPPVLNSISIDKTTVVSGDTVKITINATDNGGSGIKYVSVCYRTPITNKDKYINLKMVQAGVYEGNISLTDLDESGIWKIRYIDLTDNVDNEVLIYNSDISSITQNKDLSNCNFELTGTTADTTPPILNSIKIDKTSVVTGDTVKITINATDNGGSGIKYVSVCYRTPVTNKDKYINLKMVQTGVYEGNISLTDLDESGIWKIRYIDLTDNIDNQVLIYNSDISSITQNKDLSNCNFELTGTTADTTPPILNNIKIDKTSVVTGDTVKITINATDNGGSGVKYVSVCYRTPITNKDKYINLKMVQAGVYEGKIGLTDLDELGIWKIRYIGLTDNIDNQVLIYNSDISSITSNKDFSDCNFELNENPIKPLPQSYVTQNETWTNKIINGDLYIGPNAVLTINGPVTINGNIYVLGAIINYGNLTVNQSIYARSFSFGYSTLYNGTVLFLGGTNNVSSMIASNTPFNIPWKIYEANNKTIAVVNNTLNITGSIVPVADLYVDGTKVDYYSNGTFNLQIDVTNKDAITFEVVDVYGNRKATTYYLEKVNGPIQIPVEGVSLDVTEASLIVNDNLKLNAFINPEDASINDVIWTSSNVNVIKVDDTGLVSAVGPGNASITVTTVDGRYTASCNITVNPINVASVSLNKTTDTLIVGDTDTLTAKITPDNATNQAVTWKSSNTSIATVDNTGKVTAVGVGTATITATSEDGNKTASCTVDVNPIKVTSVSLNKVTDTLIVGDTDTLTAKITPDNATNQAVTWKSSNASIATVDNTGKVTAVGVGTTTITATSVDGGYTASCKVTITSNDKPVISGASDRTIKVGDSFDVRAGVTAADTEDGNLTSKIVVSSSVDTTKQGNYTVIYTITDSNGNIVSKSIIISVVNRNVQVISLIGSDRYDTAVKLSQSQYVTTDTIIIVNGEAMADGLGATPLAKYKNAPLLLTDVKSLPNVTINEIKRLKAKNAIIVGGTGVVSNNVNSQLQALGLTVVRISGSDRYGTSLEVAKYIDKNCYDVSKIVISNGHGEADALSIASAAGRDNMPIILVEKDNVPAAVYDWLASENLEDAYIIGGTGVVSDNVLNKIDTITLANVRNNRLGGQDRFETNSLVIDRFYGNIINKTFIAKGYVLIDALAAGSVAAINGAPVVLSDKDLTMIQKTSLQKRYGDTIIRTGGGISDLAINSLIKCIQHN